MKASLPLLRLRVPILRAPSIKGRADDVVTRRRRLHVSAARLNQPEDTHTAPYFDFGDYSIILPPENELVGVSHIRQNVVPSTISRPDYARNSASLRTAEDSSRRESLTSRIPLGGDEERRMKQACLLAKDTLRLAGSLVRPGMTTEKIDDEVHSFIMSKGGYPSPLRYKGFPKSICTSVNNIISHGIPNGRPLESGDIINIDVTVFLDGFHGDTSRTFQVGLVDEKGQDILKVAETAMNHGISACGPGRPFNGIGSTIHDFIYRLPTRSRFKGPRPSFEGVEYSVCESFTGHGIGRVFHTRPWIIHTVNDEPEVMQPGDCFTIEPIILQTDPKEKTNIWLWADGWTASTENAARGAVFEHTVMITDTGVEVLTQ